MQPYEFKEIEAKWQSYWDKIGLYQTPKEVKKKFYLLEMFAYPSGDIHMGHFRNYTIGDVFWRYLKMRGYDLLHPFGWDAFGLPAENAAISRKIHPRTWTMNNINTSRTTLKKMGISYDWEREIITCNPEYYKWTQWIFLLLYHRGLAYRARALVNWCPGCQTVLANEQVVNGACQRCDNQVTKRELEQWFFKITAYAERLLKDIDRLDEWPENIKTMQRNWIGKSEGTEIKFPLADQEGFISVFTTRPDTIYGVTFLAIAPENPIVHCLTHPEAKAQIESYIKKALTKSEMERTAIGEKDGVFTGTYALHPFSGEKVPIWVADYVLPHYGTGIVMGVPAHDQRDFLFARKYQLPMKVVINPPGQILIPETMTQAYVEPGIMTNSGPFNGMPSEEGIKKVTEYAQQKGLGEAKVYYRLKDWLISRQRYWGAPIPIIHCPRCGLVPVPENHLPVLLPPDVKDFIPKGRSPLADVAEFIKVKCPSCEGAAERDPDTMDTFVCSSWYHLRYSDPHNDKEPFDRQKIVQWLPIDLYIGGAEHACGHLIYFRFITKVLYDAGWLTFDEPAKRLFNHGMVLDAKGEVMSKSKGNVVSPMGLMEKWGVDTARLAMLFFAPSDCEIRWTEKGLVGAKRFLSRVWNLVTEAKTISITLDDQQRLRRKMHLTIKRVTEDIDPKLEFNTAISAIMELVNEIYEVVRQSSASKLSAETPSPIIREAIKLVVILLAPFVPHIAEELWEKLGEKPTIFQVPWPSYDPEAIIAEEIEIAIQINGRLKSRIKVTPADSEESIRLKALNDEKIKKILGGRSPQKVIVVPGRIVNIVM